MPIFPECDNHPLKTYIACKSSKSSDYLIYHASRLYVVEVV